MKEVDKINLNELQEMSEKMFGAMVKADEKVRTKIKQIIAGVVYE
jgi:hypothetical protein